MPDEEVYSVKSGEGPKHKNFSTIPVVDVFANLKALQTPYYQKFYGGLLT